MLTFDIQVRNQEIPSSSPEQNYLNSVDPIGDALDKERIKRLKFFKICACYYFALDNLFNEFKHLHNLGL